MAAGTRNITASYFGNTSFASTFQSTSLVVNKAVSTTTLSTSANPAILGQSVTFTATTGTASGLPKSGNVTFRDGSSVLGTINLQPNQTAVFSTTTLATGAHVISATYNGDTNFTTSSGSVTQAVRSACDANIDGLVDVADVGRMIQESLGTMFALDDLSHDTKVNVVDIQAEINAVRGGSCAN